MPANKSETTAQHQANRVIVDDLRERARSYSEPRVVPGLDRYADQPRGNGPQPHDPGVSSRPCAAAANRPVSTRTNTESPTAVSTSPA